MHSTAEAIQIDLALSGDAPVQIEIVDVAGRRVARQDVKPSAQIRVPVDPGPGVYFVRVRQGADQATGRVAVVR